MFSVSYSPIPITYTVAVLTALNSLPNSRLLQYLITIISIMDKLNRTRDTLALTGRPGLYSTVSILER